MLQNHIVKIGGALTLTFGLATGGHAEEPLGPLVESGIATWYGEEVAKGRDSNGNLFYNDTASGQKFDPDLISAAHLTLPLPSCVIVVAENGERLRVNVNDRGPYIDGKILDLSRAAAEELGVKDQGNFHVSIYMCPA